VIESRREQFRALLRRTLDEQLSAQARAADSGGNRRRLSGPWGRYFEEHSAWDCATELNRDLYRDLSGQFNDGVVRETLLAAAGVKISRTSLDEAKVALLQVIAERHGFQIVKSEQKWAVRADLGKGGWANRMDRLTDPGEAGGVCNVYIASDVTLAATGRMLDEAREDDLFGALLGIPSCCREAYERFRPLAEEKQYDFVPHVLDSTSGAAPYDWRLNYLAQYFGCSLLSFFPCSFRCPAAIAVAEGTLTMLARCDASWARRCVELQQTNVLYSENSGLHLLRTRLCNGVITYKPEDLQSSEATELAYLLQRGDRLEVSGKHSVQVYRGSTKIGELSGEAAGMCAFH